MSVKRISRVLTLATALLVAVLVVFFESRRFLAEAAPAPNIDTSPKVQSSEAFGLVGGCTVGGVFIPNGVACSDPTQLSEVCKYSQEICRSENGGTGVGSCTDEVHSKEAGTICRQGAGCRPHSVCDQDGWCRDPDPVVCPPDTECRRYGCPGTPGVCQVIFEQPPVNAVCTETRAEPVCGERYWVRYTTVTPAKCGGASCPADFQLDGPACPPVDCEVGPWTDPSNKPTCGTYTQTRAVTKPAAYGGRACPELTRTVDLGSCAVDCQVSGWVNPSPLPTCGSYTRVRTVTQQPQNGGAACPALTEEVQLAPCPVDCLLDEWRDPSPKPTCGTYTRTRAILRQPANGGLACGATSETVNLGPCPTCSCVYEMSSSLAGTVELEQACSSICMTKGVRGIAEWSKSPSLTMAQCTCMDIPESPCPVDMSTSRYSAPYKKIGSFQPDRCIPSGLPTPVDCVMGPWVYPNPLPACGTVIRTRSILVQPANNGAPCGATQEPYSLGECAPTKVTCFGSVHQRPYLTDDPLFSVSCTDITGANVNGQLRTLGSFAAGPGRNAPAREAPYEVPFASPPAGDGYEVTTVPAKVKVVQIEGSCSVTPQGIVSGTAITEATLGAVGNGTFSYKYKVAGSLNSFAPLVVDGTFKPEGGTYSIEASFIPSDTNYSPTTCTGTLMVTAAPVATCACSYSVAAGNPNGGAVCKDTCDSVSSPKSQYFSPGYCVCRDMNVKVCPATALGAPWNVAATAPESCKRDSTSKVTTSCTWGNPTPITYGATIPPSVFDPSKSGPQLASDVAGTFTFTDKNGTVIDATKALPAGTHLLTATFNPSEPATYSGTSCSANLTVNPAELIVSGKNYRRPYGWNNEALTYTFSGFVNGDTAASVVTSDASWGEAPTTASPPKLYTVELFPPSMRGSNYKVKTIPATIDVYKHKVECFADSHFIKAGAALPKLTHRCHLLVGGDTEQIFGDPPLKVQGRTDIPGTADIVYTVSEITHPYYEIVKLHNGYLYVTSLESTSCKWDATLTLTYGSKLPASLFDPSKSGPYETKGIPGKFSFSHSETSPLSVGTTRVKATFEPTDFANYANSECSTDVVVTEAIVECEIHNKSRTYGSPNPDNTYTCSGLKGTDTITTAGTFKAGPALDAAPGQSPIEFESLPKASASYIVKEKPATLTIEKAPARCSADYKEMYVKGTVPSPLTHSCTGLVLGQTKDIFGVPPLRIIGDLTVGGFKTISYDPLKPITHPNYTVETAPGSLLVKDQQATKCSWNNNTPLSLKYGDAVSGDYFDSLKLGAKEASGISGTFTYTHVAGWKPSAGQTTMRATFTPTNPERYLGTTCDLVVDVAKATLECSPPPISRLYGDSNPPFTYNCTGFVGTDNMSIVSGGTFSAGPAVKAEPDGYIYSLTSDPSAGPNYTVKRGWSTITVKPRPAKCWAENKSMTVGGVVPSLTHLCSGLPADEDYKTVFGDPKLFVDGSTTTAGSPRIKFPTGGIVHQNYIVTAEDGILTVTGQNLLTCSWATASAITYPTALPASIFDLSKNGPKLSVTGINGQWSFTRTAGTILNRGTHTISATFKPSSPTYTEAKCDTSIVVNPYPFKCEGGSYERSYGAADPTFNYTCTDGVGSDYKPKLTTQGVFKDGPGSTAEPKDFYSIDFSVLPSAGSNYEVTTVPARLVVKPKTVTCTVQDFTREYGLDNPPLTFTCSGFVTPDTKDNVFLSTVPTTTATKFSGPNSYPITLAAPTSSNYTFKITNALMTVNAAAVRCEGDNKSRVYNTTNPLLGYNCKLVRDNTPLTITGAKFRDLDFPGATAKVDVYPITFETKPTNTNYTINWVSGSITVTQANSTCSLAPSQMLAGDTILYSKLNPSMSPAGIMTYYYSDNTKVSEGVVLQGGTYQIKADLAPTDFNNYKPTSCTGTLSVLTTTSCTAKFATGLKLGPTTAFNQTFVASGLLASDPTLDGTWVYTINGSPINYTTRPTSKTTVVGTFTPSKAGYAPATCQTTINPVACLTASDCTANDNNDCTDNACNFSGVCYNKYKGASGALSPTVTLTCPNTFRIEFNDVLRCVDPTDSKAKYQIGVQSSGLAGWPTYPAGLLDTSAGRAGFNCAGGKCSFQSTSIANTNFVSGKTIYAGVMAFANQAFLNSVPDLYAKEFTSAAATCALCGNKKIETGEECDGTALPAGAAAGSTCTAGCHLNSPPGASCKSLYSTKPGYATYTEGYGPTSGENATIACQKASDKLTAKLATLNLTGLTVVKDVPDDFYQWNSTLQIDQIGCTATACVYTAPPPPSTSLCGNGVIDAGEQCEGSVDSSCAEMGCTCVGCQYKCPDTAYTGGCYTYVWFEKDYNLACQPGEMTTQTMHTKWGEDLYEIMIPEKTSGTGYISWPVTPSGPGSCCPKQGGTTKKVQVPCGGQANITLSSECTAANSQKDQLTFCHYFSGYENLSIPLTESGYKYGDAWVPTPQKYPMCATAQ